MVKAGVAQRYLPPLWGDFLMLRAGNGAAGLPALYGIERAFHVKVNQGGTAKRAFRP